MHRRHSAMPSGERGHASAASPPTAPHAIGLADKDTLDRLAGAVAAVTETQVAVASIFDGTRQTFAGAYGLVEPSHSRRWTDEASRMCRTVADTGSPVLVQDARRRAPDTAPGRWGGFDVAGYAGIPLMTRVNEPFGALTVLSSAPRTWRGRDLVVLHGFGEAFAAILDRGRLRHDHDALEHAALHDDLTGLLNRRGFHLVASAQLALAHRQRACGVLIFLDLDGLKVTNDRDGHAAGDHALRAAADVLRAVFRESDCVARIGGDEFVVLAVAAPSHDVATIMTRLSAELERVNRHEMSPLAWSVGIVEIDHALPVPLDMLLAEADRRMYVSKRDSVRISRRVRDGGRHR